MLHFRSHHHNNNDDDQPTKFKHHQLDHRQHQCDAVMKCVSMSDRQDRIGPICWLPMHTHDRVASQPACDRHWESSCTSHSFIQQTTTNNQQPNLTRTNPSIGPTPLNVTDRTGLLIIDCCTRCCGSAARGLIVITAHRPSSVTAQHVFHPHVMRQHLVPAAF